MVHKDLFCWLTSLAPCVEAFWCKDYAGINAAFGYKTLIFLSGSTSLLEEAKEMS
jgi:hypothetical protein